MKKQKHNTNPKAALCVFAGITCGAALVLSPLQIHAAESTALPVTSTAEQQNDVIASGEKNYISWTLTADGTLTVTGYGQGTMNDYDQNETYVPWNDYGPQVKKIIIGQGVTSVGKHAFYNCKNATEIEIGNSVKKIASCAFGSTFTSVTIPASVTSIDKYAFTSAAASQGYYVDPQNQYYSNDEKGVLFDKNKTQLQHAPLNLNGKYVVPDTVTTLVDYCFDGCDKLTELEVGNSVTAIQTSAFGTCTHMKTLTIGNGVQDVGNLFSRCNLPELETLNLGSGFTKIEYLHNLPSVMNINVSASNTSYTSVDGILYSKDKTILEKFPCGRIGTFQIPEGVTCVRGFANCKIENLVIPEGITRLEKFSGCKNLTELQIPDSVTELGSASFENCTNLEKVKLSNKIKKLDQFSFNGCSKLKEVILPEKLETIEQYAFEDCVSLTEITLPKKLNSLERGTFSGCTTLSKVTFTGSAPYIDESAFENVSAVCYYPKNNLSWTEDKMANYRGNLTWLSYEVNEFEGEEHTYTVPDTNATLAYQIDENTSTAIITKCNIDATGMLTIPDAIDGYRVVEIGAEAFKECVGLEDVTIPQTVTKIGEKAFIGCKKLAHITIPEGITEIKAYTFSGCGLTSLEFPESLVEIGDYAFQNLKMQELTIPEHIKVFGKGIFANSALRDVVLPDNLSNIPDNTFENNYYLHNVKLPQSLVTIGDAAFAQCYELYSMELPEGVTSIGNSAFSGCGEFYSYSGLYSANHFTSITLPSTLRYIGASAFFRCEALTSIAIPDKVEKISSSAFAYCYSLRTVILPTGVTSIDKGAFAQCADRVSGVTITFRWNVPQIDTEAFRSIKNGTAYYPSNNPDWTSSMLQQYGAKKLEWVAQEMEKPEGAGGGSGGNPGGDEGDDSGETGGNSKPINVNVNNGTSQAGESGASLTPPEKGWTTGSNTFSVSSGSPCMVAVSKDGGQSYERLPATANEDGSYSFTAEDMTQDSTLAIVLLGDINGDGKVTAADATKGSAAVLNKVELEPLQKLAADTNNDGKLTTADITRLRAAVLGNTSLQWQ